MFLSIGTGRSRMLEGVGYAVRGEDQKLSMQSIPLPNQCILTLATKAFIRPSRTS